MFMMPDPFELLDEIDYEEAAFRGGTKPRKLPILVARGAALPAGLEGLMLTSDLQGMEPLASVPQPRPLANLVLDRLGSAAGRGLRMSQAVARPHRRVHDPGGRRPRCECRRGRS